MAIFFTFTSGILSHLNRTVVVYETRRKIWETNVVLLDLGERSGMGLARCGCSAYFQSGEAAYQIVFCCLRGDPGVIIAHQVTTVQIGTSFDRYAGPQYFRGF